MWTDGSNERLRDFFVGVVWVCILSPVRSTQHHSTAPNTFSIKDQIRNVEAQLEQRENEVTQLKKEMGKERKTNEEVWARYLLQVDMQMLVH